MEIINNIQKEILKSFPNIVDSENFYLTGGTALSLFYLKYRISNDLDFFTPNEEIIIPFSYKLEDFLKTQNITVQRQRSFHSFVELLATKNDQMTSIHLAFDSPFRLEKTQKFVDYPKIRVDNLNDLAANKLLALFGRAMLRDFIDVFFLIKKAKFSKNDLMEKAKTKDPGFDLYWLGVAFERINLFNDDSPEMLMLIESVSFKELSDFFNEWKEEISKKLLDN